MIYLTALEWFNDEAAVRAPFQMDRDKPEIAGLTVDIDGAFYEVLGVHRHMPSHPIRAGEVIGLRVKKKPRR